MNRNYQSNGFTLIELVIVLGIMCGIFLYSLPGFLSVNENTHLTTMEIDIINALNYSRNTSLLLGRTLALNPDPHTNNWSDGLILFQDNATHQYHEHDKIYYQWHWSNPEVKVQWHGFRSDKYLVFASDPNHSSLSGHFNVMSGKGRETRIVINRFGRVKRGKVDD